MEKHTPSRLCSPRGGVWRAGRSGHLAILRALLLASAMVVTFNPIAAAQETGGRVRVGGVGRYVPNRWGLAKGVFANRSDRMLSLTAVVTPPSSNGLQYARRIELPARSSRTVSWPMRMSDIDGGLREVEFLVFDPGAEDGSIQRRGPDIIRTFTTNVRLTEYGHTGMITSGDEPHREKAHLQQLLRTMQAEARREQILINVQVPELEGTAHALDALDQLSVTSRTLIESPEACEAIRIWVQRGGRLHIAVDLAGVEVARALLGEALPLTLVDRTSSNTLKLQLNPSYSEMRFQVREVTREFDEPADLVRVIAEGGEVIWSIDGWPAAIRTDYGRGQVLVTTTVPGAFIHPVPNQQTASMIASSARFAETMFAKPEQPLVSRDLAVTDAASKVGYAIPSRGFAALIVIAFPLVLLACGVWLRRGRRGEWLVLCVPALALAVSIPAGLVGMSSRGVAPPTAIRHQVVRAVDGESVLAADGFITLYSPDSKSLAVEANSDGLFVPPDDPNNKNYRRLVWTSGSDASWQNLAPPAGLHTAESRETLTPAAPLAATATLDENGLAGQLMTGDLVNASDAVLGSAVPSRQAVSLDESGQWTSGRGDVLTQTEFFRASLLTEQQKSRAAILDAVLGSSRSSPVPNRLSLFYFAQVPSASLDVGDANTRQESDVLIVQPVRLVPPAVGQQVTIPPVLLPYRSIVDATGGLSPLYSNRQRKWAERERPGAVMLAFDFPPELLPFESTSVELEIRAVAGSRTLEVFSGSRDDPKLVQRLESPVGSFTVPLPAGTIAAGERLYVRLAVGENTVEREEGVTDVDQDDRWRIERVLMTVQGKRLEPTTGGSEAVDD